MPDPTRNLLLGTDGDLVVSTGQIGLVSGLASIGQAVRCALQYFRGEDIFDDDNGVPYFQSVFVKQPRPGLLRGTFRDAILGVPGVLDVTQLGLDFDGATRELTVAFRATTDLGEIEDVAAVEV